MQLKTLSLNKALFSNLSRSIIFLTIINIICTFILVPFSYVIAHIDSGAGPHNHSKYLIGETMTMPIYFVGTMLYTLLCAAFLTYYFKSQAASDFIHSLPIKRERILITAYAVFLSHLLVNLLLNGLITWIVEIKYASIDIEKIVIWILVNLVIDFFIFTITMLFGLFINNMLNHLVSSLILIASPFILGTMVYTTHMFMFKGLQNYPDELMTNLTVPIRFINDIAIDQVDFKYLIMIFLVSTVIFILLFVIYKQRKNERINEAYSTNYAHFFVFFISMLIATLLGGIIFNSIFNEQKFITIFIYLVSFTLIYIFLEMIAQKSVRINFDRKLYALTLGMIAVAIVAIYISGQMREKYVPQAEKVESVILKHNENEYGESLTDNVKITSQKAIDNITKAHRFIKDKSADNYMNYVVIKYQMKSGKIIERNYNYQDQYDRKFNALIQNGVSNNEFVDNIPWDKLKKHDLAIIAEHQNNFSGSGSITNKDFDDLKPLLQKTLEYNVNRDPLIQDSKTGVFLQFSESFNAINESFTESGMVSIPISIYDEDMIKYLIDNKVFNKKSDLLPGGTYYYLGNVSNFYKVDLTKEDIKDYNFAKKINKQELIDKIDNNKINPKGKELYYLSESSSFIVVDK
ncbi:hypothetical protein ACMGE9_03295 [Macrococcus sp. EM39E]|uniref:hypothetical protein n=1 Tax=Macrococcus animalis TaxID=3395467 RepID=UPI0039BDAB65